MVLKLMPSLQMRGIKCDFVSTKINKVIRLLDVGANLIWRAYDVIHVDVFSDNAFYITMLASRIAKIRNKPIIFNIRGGRFLEFYGQYRNRIESVLKKNAKAEIISPSRFITKGLNAHGIDCAYLPNFIAIERFPYKVRNANFGKKILWVRAFSEVYNPLIAVEVVKILSRQFPDVRLTMVGPDKGVKGQVLEAIKTNNLTDVITLVGPVPHEELYQYYHSHDIYLNTTSYESFGNAVFEAASCGLPVISTSVGELPALWTNEVNAMLTPVSATYLAEAMAKVIQTPELYLQLSVKGRFQAEQFSRQQALPRWEALLNKWSS